jgi:hypothetical protein
MTLFTATGVQLDSFEYDGTAGLLRLCKEDYGGCAPLPVDDGRGRRHVTRQQLIEFIGRQNPLFGVAIHGKSPAKRQEAIDWFHQAMFAPGVDSSIYTVNQTLVTVHATYLLPAEAAPAAAPAATSASASAAAAKPDVGLAKQTANSNELGYGDRISYYRGLAEIVFARRLTMAEEWARNHRWEDWTGKSFEGKAEFNYVWSEPAVEGRAGIPNFDEGHGGMVLAEFRQLFVSRVAAAGGDAELVPTLAETAAARLYTGPAYVKLNGFMRLVGKEKTRHWRARLAQLVDFTYSSTVLHLVNAIRKIAQIDALERQNKLLAAAGGGAPEQAPEESEAMLYRGVRGKLPKSFFVPDVQGFISAVDYGFTSTSADAAVPVSFMAPDQLNVLWVLHCADGADSAGQLHNGAVLQPLSLFPAEAEALLPPLCMLQVLREGGAADTAGTFRIEHNKRGKNKKGEVVTYTEIHARPCFV